MPTDAPKGIWPFSVDSDSSWNPEQPESHAVGNKHLAAECSAGRTWLEPQAHLPGLILRGPVCPVILQ